MKIVHLPSDFFPSIGGTEIYVENLGAELAELGCTNIIVKHGGEPANHRVGKAVLAVEALRELKPTKADLYSFTAGYDLKDFADLLDREQPDILHFHALTCAAGISHARLARAKGIPYVVTYHTPNLTCARGTMLLNGESVCDGRIETERCAACLLTGAPLRRRIANLFPAHNVATNVEKLRQTTLEFFEHAAAVIVPAAWAQGVLELNGVPRKKISLIRQGLPGEDRERSVAQPAAIAGDLQIGYFGRINYHQKGLGTLLGAARALVNAGAAFRLELVGKADDLSRKKFSRELPGLGEHAHHRGVLTGTALREWIRSRHVIVVPSDCLETGPLAVLEAWDEGVPVIGTDIGGIREWLKDTPFADLLFAWKSSEDLARALLQFKRGNPRNVFVKIPGMAGVARKTLEIYRGASGASVSVSASRSAQHP